MYAVGLNNYAGPEVLHLMELPDPHPEPGHVRVRVRSAGINPVDVMVRDGSLAEFFAGLQPPFVPGMDISGTIDEVGEEHDPEFGLAVGQKVVAVVNNRGSYGGYSQQACAGRLFLLSVTAARSSSCALGRTTASNAASHRELAKGGQRGRIILNFDGLEE
jgi:NADPH:quinone reductase-like Zn-dependent oxidoreductase